MSTTTIVYGTRTAFPGLANLDNLGAGTACALGAVDTTATGADGFLVDFAIQLGAAGVSASGTLTLYLIQSATSASSGFTDGISPTGASVSIANARPIATYNATSNGQVVADTFRLPVPDPAKYWSLVVSNGSGAGLAASGHSANTTALTYATA